MFSYLVIQFSMANEKAAEAAAAGAPYLPMEEMRRGEKEKKAMENWDVFSAYHLKDSLIRDSFRTDCLSRTYVLPYVMDSDKSRIIWNINNMKLKNMICSNSK